MAEADEGESSPDAHDELMALRAEFIRSTTPLQRFMSWSRELLAAPPVAICVALAAVAWALANTWLGRRALDPPPFAALETLATVAALVATLLILAGQRREDEAAQRIGRLTLHLAAESEQKIAKLIALVEEQRRDSASLPERTDAEAERMASPSGPRAVLERLEADVDN